MKPVVYTTSRGPYDPAFEYRNPRFFTAPMGKPEDVIIIGEWPAIAEAYAARGVRVHDLPAGVTPRLTEDVPAPPAGLLDATLSRGDIAKMPRAEVVKRLRAHGVENVTGPIADLRADLACVMFGDE